jgi:hypothetical protein
MPCLLFYNSDIVPGKALPAPYIENRASLTTAASYRALSRGQDGIEENCHHHPDAILSHELMEAEVFLVVQPASLSSVPDSHLRQGSDRSQAYEYPRSLDGGTDYDSEGS